MKTYICEICGDAYLGVEKPKNCPFCGANENFIKDGNQANPIVSQGGEISEISGKNLMETLNLEMDAVALYTCMAEEADTYEIKAMYKRLAKVELEHASVVCKLLKIEKPEVDQKECSREDMENFEKTIELEENASNLYSKFSKESEEQHVKIFFTALAKVEQEHIDLIKKYLN